MKARARKARRFVDLETIELMLAHEPENKVAATYDRHQHMERRRILAQEWPDVLFNGLPGRIACSRVRDGEMLICLIGCRTMIRIKKRTAVRWSAADDADLKRMFEAGADNRAIAQALNRSVAAVNNRLNVTKRRSRLFSA